MKCVPCYQYSWGCSECDQTARNCNECYFGYFLLNGVCHLECPKGYQEIIENSHPICK